MQDPDVPGRFTSGEYVVDIEDDRSLTVWSTETGDAMAIPNGQARAVLFLVAEAYVHSGRFSTDKERKAFADSQAATA